jgi:predicted SAM-dependent methyltransferase
MKLELGGGSSPKRKEQGFLNCDCRDLPEVDIRINLRDAFPFQECGKQESDPDKWGVEAIFSAHCLEHFTLPEVRHILSESLRVLLPGGRIELVVPNARKLAERYIRGEYDCATFSHMMYGGQDYEHNFHYTCFDFSFLASLLEEAGFVGIKPVACEDVNELGVEARKPGDAE